MRASFFSLVLSVCGLVLAAEAHAFCHATTVQPPEGEVCTERGVPLNWFDRCQEVRIFPRRKPGLSAAQLRTVVQRSFDTWDAVRCNGEPVGLRTTVSAEPATENIAHHDGEANENIVVFVDDPAEWEERMNDPFAIAVTVTYHGDSSGRIYGADMEMNDWGYNLRICDRVCGANMTDLQNVLTHEAGHFYGLGHTPRGTPATMEVEARAGEVSKRDLDPDDVAGICSAYPPNTFGEACTGSSFYEARLTQAGCGCSTLGGALNASLRAWCLLAISGLLIAWRMRRSRT